MARMGIIALLGVLGMGVLAGCQRQPFISELPRSPYERYMALRGKQRAETQRNEFGMPERNARERLKPLEQ